MFRLGHSNKFSLKVNRCLLVLLLSAIAIPLQAHKVQISETVGGTLHIEPNDTPRSGEAAIAWFALTRQGGQTIPLEACDCSLSIYSEPVRPDQSPILTPPLKAVSAEQYQGIPGAEIVFPQPGAYQLKLTGEPQENANFEPFELTFDVTVATGKTVSQATPKTTPQSTASPTASESSETPTQWPLPVVVIIIVVLVAGLLWTTWRDRK